MIHRQTEIQKLLFAAKREEDKNIFIKLISSKTAKHVALLLRSRVFLNVLTAGTFAPFGPFASPAVKAKSLHLPQWPKSKWGPFLYDFPS